MKPATFKAVRKTDETGVSGAGHVADGVVFEDGTTVLRWRTKTRSTAVYASFEDMKTIHGHDGATVFEFDIPPTGGPKKPPEKQLEDAIDAIFEKLFKDFTRQLSQRQGFRL